MVPHQHYCKHKFQATLISQTKAYVSYLVMILKYNAM